MPLPSVRSGRRLAGVLRSAHNVGDTVRDLIIFFKAIYGEWFMPKITLFSFIAQAKHIKTH